jgi:hypothetical protein
MEGLLDKVELSFYKRRAEALDTENEYLAKRVKTMMEESLNVYYTLLGELDEARKAEGKESCAAAIHEATENVKKILTEPGTITKRGEYWNDLMDLTDAYAAYEGANRKSEHKGINGGWFVHLWYQFIERHLGKKLGEVSENTVVYLQHRKESVTVGQFAKLVTGKTYGAIQVMKKRYVDQD